MESYNNLPEYLSAHTPTIIGMDQLKKYAVVVPLIKKDSGYEILFEVRSAKMNRQPGDICLPGGRLEEGESPKEGGLRELREELLLDPSQVRYLGELNTLLNQGREKVTMLAAEILNYEGTKNESEIDEIFTVPVNFFAENDPKIYTIYQDQRPAEDFPYDLIHNGRDYQWRAGIRRVVFYQYEDRVIWGMTGLLMEDFARIVRKGLTL